MVWVVLRTVLVVNLGCGADADAFEADLAPPADFAEVCVAGVSPPGAVNSAVTLPFGRIFVPWHCSVRFPLFAVTQVFPLRIRQLLTQF